MRVDVSDKGEWYKPLVAQFGDVLSNITLRRHQAKAPLGHPQLALRQGHSHHRVALLTCPCVHHLCHVHQTRSHLYEDSKTTKHLHDHASVTQILPYKPLRKKFQKLPIVGWPTKFISFTVYMIHYSRPLVHSYLFIPITCRHFKRQKTNCLH